MAKPNKREGEISGAEFGEDRKYRYVLWRIWDIEKPTIMFIGLNPSKAGEFENDRTITRVCGMAKGWGYGGIYMMNCFPYISTDPEDLKEFGNTSYNDKCLREVMEIVSDVIFAWGKFPIVKERCRDVEIAAMYPGGKALIHNKDGSPRHPLYVPKKTTPVPYKNTP